MEIYVLDVWINIGGGRIRDFMVKERDEHNKNKNKVKDFIFEE
jgi:hypothetical protein